MVALIFLILYWTYHDLADAVLMMLAVPGAIAGGLFFQWLLGLKLSVTVWVGYIACFGMATSTGIIMLVYLREAVARAGGLERIEPGRAAPGRLERRRPPPAAQALDRGDRGASAWPRCSGPAASASEIIRPMAAPVLGGILVADEVIDLFLPVLFYWVRRRRWERLHRGSVIIEAVAPRVIRQSEQT